MNGGYPTADAAGIQVAATINTTAGTGDYTLAGSNPFVIQPINGGSATCQVSYANTGAGTFTTTITNSGCGLDVAQAVPGQGGNSLAFELT